MNKARKHNVYRLCQKVPDGFEPPIRELQSHALPLGYGTIPRNYTIFFIFVKKKLFAEN